jgi:hypothetical protein
MLRYFLAAFLVALSVSAPATAQVYCYNPATQKCFISSESFCPVYQGIPVSRDQCIERERINRPQEGPRCCYSAGTGRKYKTNAECGTLEQDIGLAACERTLSLPWCLIVEQRKVFRANTTDCPSGTMTITEDQARLFQ